LIGEPLPLKPLEFFIKRPYENQVLVLLFFLIAFRMVLSIGQDIFSNETQFIEVLVDWAMLTLFGGLFVYSYLQPTVSSFHPSLGVIIICLMGLNFIQFGGVNGSTEFNYYACVFIVVLVYSGRQMRYLLGFQVLLLIVLLVLQVTDNPLWNALFLRQAGGYVDFIFGIVSILVISYFLRWTTMQEVFKYEARTETLQQKVRSSRRQNADLIEQDRQLMESRKHLEDEVAKRTKAIEAQNEAIRQFIEFNTNSLYEPRERLTKTIKSLSGKSNLHELMLISSEELNLVMDKIHDALSNEEMLNRKKIKPS
jgi:hypothetical protein